MNLRSMKRSISALLIAILLLAAPATGAQAAVQARVNSTSARAYASASAGAKSVKLSKNQKLKISAISGGWAKVNYKGKAAYVKLSKLTPTNKRKRYAKRDIKVYNASGAAVGALSKGDGVYLLGKLGSLCCVMSGGDLGFVQSGTLSAKKPGSSTSPAKQTKADKAVKIARGLVGASYALDDNPPHSFNCSSFVQYCMNKAGVPMKNTAAKQAADTRYSKITSLSKLKKGDVLFFAGEGEIDHSAIYLGNGEFIEASANAGGVQINSFNDWYKTHFRFARRPK